jgi:hypothetical protein
MNGKKARVEGALCLRSHTTLDEVDVAEERNLAVAQSGALSRSRPGRIAKERWVPRGER